MTRQLRVVRVRRRPILPSAFATALFAVGWIFELWLLVRQGLGQGAFDAAWAEGAALSIDEAVAYASRARGERKRPSAGLGQPHPHRSRGGQTRGQGPHQPEIGERLFIGRGTVKNHLAHIFTKLGFSTRAELAAEATRRNL